MNFLNSKGFTLTNQLTQVIAVVVGLVVLTLLISQLTLRVDLTQNQLFSVSPSTTETLKELDDIVTVKVYQSANIPPRFQPVVSDVKDMLLTYDRAGGDKLKLEYLVVDDNPTLEEEAKSYGLQPIQFNTIENDQYQVASGFLGLVMLYGDQTELIPILTNVSNLEYELTSRLLSLTKDTTTIVGFTTGHDEWGLTDENGIALFSNGLRQQHTVKTVEISDEEFTDLTPQADLLIVAGPKQQFSRAALLSLDQFILSGRPVIFLTDGVTVDQNLKPQPADHNLYDLLAHHGVTLGKDLVVDKSFQPAFFQSPQGSFQAPYPLWVRIGQKGVNPELPVVNQLDDLVTPWVSSLLLADDSTQVLISSSPESYLQLEEYDLDPASQWQFDSMSLQSYPLGMTKSGPATSYFDPTASADITGFDPNTFTPQTENTSLSVIADSDLIRDFFIQDVRKVQNAVLVANLVDSMLLGDKLISIRSKAVGTNPIELIEGPKKTQIRATVILLPILIVALIAIWQLIIVPKRLKS